VADTSITTANLGDYYARTDTTVAIGANDPNKAREPVINRRTRRHEKALLRRAGKNRPR
jgi:hypothetical protein